ncbi:2502_t:CDS:2 [Entrophospora sp. SA101]|nr:2502_t:CDS:2 [Entrophospora sp. SA101]
MRSNAPAGINEFFIALKNMWLERSPNLYGGSISNQISQMPSITPQSTITSTEIMKPESELQSNNSGITKTEIENIVNSQLDLRIQETQTQFLQCISGEIPEFIPVPPHSLHLKPQVKKNTTSDTDSVEEITKCLANMSLKMAKNINVVAKTV